MQPLSSSSSREMSSETPPTDAGEPARAERRRSPRFDTGPELSLSIPVISSGEIIDVSATGILLSTTLPLNVGDRARLSLLLGRRPFSALVRVVRSEEGTRGGKEVRYHLGLAFTSVEAQSLEILQRFVEPGKTS